MLENLLQCSFDGTSCLFAKEIRKPIKVKDIAEEGTLSNKFKVVNLKVRKGIFK